MIGFPRFLNLGALAAIALVLGCGSPGVANDPQDMELRTYSVPDGFENEVRSMLRTALGTDESRVGRASLGPAGTLVVVAPSGVQKGVETLVRQLDALDSPPATPVPVTLTYWIVAGGSVGSEELTQKSGGGSAIVGRGLDELTMPLEQIAVAQGPQEFELLERLQLSSRGDEWGRMNGRHARIEQRATTVQDDVLADIRITVERYGIDTQVKVKPGQYLVLGQTGYSGEKVRLDPEDGTLALYYVITSDLE